MFSLLDQDLNTFIAYYKENFPSSIEETIRIGNDVCNNTFLFRDHWEMERTNIPITFEETIKWDSVPHGNPEWTYALNRHTCLLNLAKCYAYTQDEKYTTHFIRLLDDWLTHVPLTSESMYTTWRPIEAGLRVENWLKAIQIFSQSPLLSEAFIKRITDSLLIHKDYLLKSSTTFQALSNWGVLQDHGLFLLGLYFEDSDCIAIASNRLENSLFLQVFADGSHWEQSPMYHCEVLHCFLNFARLAKQYAVTIPQRCYDHIEKMSFALAMWCKPGNILPCQSDSDSIDASDLLAQAAVLFNNSHLKYMVGSLYPEHALWNTGMSSLLVYDKIPSIAPTYTSYALTDSGNYMLRSDLSPSANWLHMHCGTLGSGHGHADLLHIDLSAYGEDIFIDTGRYTYVNNHLRKQLKLPAAHNTTRVDGKDFSECIDSWGYSHLAVPVKGEYTFTDTADYISGAHLGYMNLESGGVFTTRKVIYYKPDIYIIVDAFYGKGTHVVEQNFHFGLTGSLSPTPQGGLFTGIQSSAHILCLGSDLNLAYSKSPCSTEYNQLDYCDTLNVSKSIKEFGCLITVVSTSPINTPHAIEAKLLPIHLEKAGTILSSDQAIGVEITKNDFSTTLILAHQEVISEVDLFSTGKYRGYGKVILFTDNTPEGLTLCW